MTVDAYAGVRRRKQTPWTVKFGDAFASKLIAVGGIGTIAAILLVVLVLLGTAWPLFQTPPAPQWRTFDCPTFKHIGLDEHELIVWGVDETGKLSVVETGSGKTLAEFPSPASDERKVTTSHLSIDRSTLVLGFSDGSYQVAEIGFKYELLNTADLPTEVTVSEKDPIAVHDGHVYQRFDVTSVRRSQIVAPAWSTPKSMGDAPVTMLDYLASTTPSAQQSKSHLVAIVGDELAFGTISRKKAPVGKKFTESLAVTRCKLNSRNAKGGPLSLTLLNGEDHAVVAWPNGTLDRFALAGESPQLVESASGLIGGGELTASAPLLARQTLLCGDDSGRVVGWNILRTKEADDSTKSQTSTPDGFQLVPAHELPLSESPIRSINSSQKNHMASIVDSEGETSLVFVTTNDVLLSTSSPLVKKRY